MKRIILIVIAAVCLIGTTCVLLVCCKKDKNPNNSIEPMYTEDSLVNSSRTDVQVVTDSLSGKKYLVHAQADKLGILPVEGDCTSNLQTALNNLSKSGGGTFFLPKGVYEISGQLTIPANVSSIGTMAFRKMGASGKLSVTFIVTEGWTCGGNAVDASFFADAIKAGNALRGADYTAAWVR